MNWNGRLNAWPRQQYRSKRMPVRGSRSGPIGCALRPGRCGLSDDLIRFRRRSGGPGARPEAQIAGSRGLGRPRGARRLLRRGRGAAPSRRSLKSDVTVPADLPDLVERLMRSRGARRPRPLPTRPARSYLRLCQGRGRDRGRRRRRPCCMPATQVADGRAKLAAALKRRHGDELENLPRIFVPLRLRIWIWHWAGQMWYMQPCWPAAQGETFPDAVARA